MRHLIILSIMLIPCSLFSQSDSTTGNFELGLRSTVSTFGASGHTGYGFGGQFRIQLSERLNTEWFADVISEDIDGFATRNDYHIGWSVMFYPFKSTQKTVVPYLLAGHCFDYTKINPTNKGNPLNQEPVSRLSSATQVGLGTHWNILPKMDISTSAQYMIHLGSDVHSHVETIEGIDQIVIEEHQGFSLEGHLLFTVSVNYKFGRLW